MPEFCSGRTTTWKNHVAVHVRLDDELTTPIYLVALGADASVDQDHREAHEHMSTPKCSHILRHQAREQAGWKRVSRGTNENGSVADLGGKTVRSTVMTGRKEEQDGDVKQLGKYSWLIIHVIIANSP